MSDQTLAIWSRVYKTDPAATKENNQGGRKSTTIDGYWMIKIATEIFGPLGIGWGYDVLEERWDKGAPFNAARDGADPYIIEGVTHTLKIKLWYMHDGQRGEITQYGHTPALYRSKWGATDDGEAPKKSLTDAIKKSLSMLGFSADIFMGQFDDAEYRESLKTEKDIERAENKDAEIEAKRAELSDYVKRNIEAVDNAVSVSEVNGICKVSLRHLERQKAIPCLTEIAEAGIKKLSLNGNTKKEELKNA